MGQAGLPQKPYIHTRDKVPLLLLVKKLKNQFRALFRFVEKLRHNRCLAKLRKRMR